jgi:LysM repeat protein
MKVLRICWLAALAVFVLRPAVGPALAQSGNLVANGDFETAGGSVGANWSPWWIETSKPSDGSLNYAYRPGSINLESKSKGAAPALILNGDSSARVINNWDPWIAGVKQTVANIPPGTRVRLTASGRAWAASADYPTPSDTTVGVGLRVGIEPNGNDYPTAAAQMTWSGFISPHDTWQQASAEAVVGASGKVTVVLYTTYWGHSRLFMASFWDGVSLTAVGSGTAPTAPPSSGGGGQPQPTSPPVFGPFITPTPGPDGNIIYTVQAGDTIWRIAANTGQTVDQIKALNGLTSNIISVGQKLVIGQGKPSGQPTSSAPTADPNQPTEASPPTATSEGAAAPTPAPTEVAAANTGEICARLYEDINGDGLRQPDGNEVAIVGGVFTIVDATTGAPVQSHNTQAGEDEYCFKNLTVGKYTIAAAAPAGYNATTTTNVSLDVQIGYSNKIEFGAQRSSGSQTAPESPANSDRLRTALFGAAGIMLLLLAAGIAGFLFLRRR